jgi:predicted nuclease of predicted toxin-antitoxin system
MDVNDMPWRPLPNPTETDDDLRKKTRIFVDENLGEEVANYLRGRGYNVVFANDVGLSGRSDEDVFAYAWRDQRMIWTHDRDFLDDARFPEHRNPGVVVLPGGGGDNDAMGAGLGAALAVFGHWPATLSKTKAIVSATGEITIRRRYNGKMGVSRYRMTRRGYAEEWQQE